MNFSYRTRRRLQRAGVTLLIILLLVCLTWLCCVVFLERFVYYDAQGAHIDLEHSANDVVGVEALPPSQENDVKIYFNEGENTVDVNKDMTQFSGYYITADALKDVASVREKLSKLDPGTAVMIELKNGFGNFYYSSHLQEASIATGVDIAAIDELIQEMNLRDLYTIARIPAFRDRAYGLVHVTSGLYHINGRGLWPDSEHCYWLNPTDPIALGWIMQVTDEVKSLGFDEVNYSYFNFPITDKIRYHDDKTAAIASAAKSLMASLGTPGFTLSFTVTDPTFQLPEGRCRMYMERVDAKDIGATAARVTVPDPKIQLVFVADSNDTRYDDYSVLRPLDAAEAIAAAKGTGTPKVPEKKPEATEAPKATEASSATTEP